MGYEPWCTILATTMYTLVSFRQEDVIHPHKHLAHMFHRGLEPGQGEPITGAPRPYERVPALLWVGSELRPMYLY